MTLALGVGASTAMFSVVHGVLLRPLGYPNAARVAQLNTLQKGRVVARMTGPDFVDIRSEASTLEQVAFYQGGDMGVQLGDHAEFAATYLVTPNFFSVVGVSPVFGRAFDQNDVRRGAIIGLPLSSSSMARSWPASGRNAARTGWRGATGTAPALDSTSASDTIL